MKNTFIIGLFLVLSAYANICNVPTNIINFTSNQAACGDCGGGCNKPEKPSVD